MIMNDFFEKTLEDIIIQNKDECIKRGFPSFYEITGRQCLLPSGSIVDIFSLEIPSENTIRCKNILN